MLVGALLIALLYEVVIMAFTVRARISAFSKEFMSQFDAEHIAAFPKATTAPLVGFPDCGDGWYGKKLSYFQWYNMGNGQRC